MAGPLSVAAGVVGLLTAAAQVTKILSNVIKNTRHVPEECRRIQTQVDDIRNVLAQLQVFVGGADRPQASRTSLILVDQVIVTLAASVMTFSELDTFVTGLQSDSELGILDKVRWVSKIQDASKVLGRLESHKASLVLMMTILTCQKQVDAENKVDKLCDLVQEVLRDNSRLHDRLAAFDLAAPPTDSIAESTLERTSTSPNEGIQVPDGVRRYAFEELLESTRVYRMARRGVDDVSTIVSSAGRTASWSMLSGLSLSEISHIGILAIPVYRTDIVNDTAYEFDAETSTDQLSTSAAQLSSSNGQAPSGGGGWLRKLVRRSPQPAANIATNPSADSPGVFGVALRQSVPYANAAINLTYKDDNRSYTYGYVPLVVAKLGMHLKEHGTSIVEIFAAHGNPVRMMHLQATFDTAPRYGKGFAFAGFTPYDTAGLLLRYLKSLPEPVIPLSRYQVWTDALLPFFPPDRSVESGGAGEVMTAAETNRAIPVGQNLVCELPPLNQQLLLYLLDLMAIFVHKAAVNKMSSMRLTAIFQPSILSGPPGVMDDVALERAAWIVNFLIENQDHFLIVT